MRLLLVDDDTDFVESTSLRLEQKGYAVETAYNGEEALHSVKKQKPDLIVLDVMMPEISGYSVCKELKNDKEYRDIPIIIVTAVAANVKLTKFTQLDGMKMGADDYLSKPVDFETLIEKIQKLTDSQ